MGSALQVSIVRPSELGAAERATWRDFRAAAPELDSPYFDLRYTLAAGDVAPHARVAILHRRGRVVGFLPFQRRGARLQPLGAPMTDYHGLVADPQESINAAELLAKLGARTFRFSGLVATEIPEAVAVRRDTLAAEIGGGFEAWAARREAKHRRFFRDRQRTARALEEAFGPLRLVWSRTEDGLIDYVLDLKRAQYRRTGLHDVFACGWTEALLRRLEAAGETDFGLGFSALYAGDRLVGADIGLISGPVYHLWLPTYDPAFARYSPGMLTTLRTMARLAEEGVRRVDFGRDDAPYKAYFADPAGHVLEGALRAPGPARGAGARLIAAAPRAVTAFHERVRRRFDVISACETTVFGQAAGIALAVTVAAGLALPAANGPQVRRPSPHRAGPHQVLRPGEGLREAVTPGSSD